MWASACRHAGDCEAMDDAHDAEFEAQQLFVHRGLSGEEGIRTRGGGGIREGEARSQRARRRRLLASFPALPSQAVEPAQPVSEASDGDSSRIATQQNVLKRRAVRGRSRTAAEASRRRRSRQ